MRNKMFLWMIVFLVSLVSATAMSQTFEGLVWADVNGTQVGVNNTNVSIYNNTGAYYGSNITNESGIVRLSLDVPQGIYNVSYNTPAGYESTYKYPVFVISAGATKDITVKLNVAPKGNFNGTVTNGTNPLANVTVTAEGPTVKFTKTDSNGNYQLVDLPVGNYTLTASKEGYNYTIRYGTITNGTTSPVNFVLTFVPQTGTIDGYVRNSTGSFVNGALVQVVQGNNTKATATTNAGGYYSLNIAEGTYNLTASEPGYNQAFRTSVQVTNSQTIQVNFTLTPAGSSCSQSVSYGGWSSCVGGQQSRTATYSNYLNLCDNTYIATETQSCTISTPSSGGGSRNRGSGLSGIMIGENLTVLNSNICSLQTRSFYVMDTTKLNYKGTVYDIRLNAIHLNNVDMIIYPVPSIKVTVTKDQTMNVDLNKDGKDDLEISLTDLNAITAKIDFKLICSEEEKKETTPAKETVEEEAGPAEKAKEALINILGEIKPKSAASVAVGSVISLSIVAVGLLIYFLIRRTRY